MFDFEKLEVYKKAKAFNKDVLVLMKNTKSIDVVTKNQLRRASLSIVLNIAEEPVVLVKLTNVTFTLCREDQPLNALPFSM